MKADTCEISHSLVNSVNTGFPFEWISLKSNNECANLLHSAVWASWRVGIRTIAITPVVILATQRLF